MPDWLYASAVLVGSGTCPKWPFWWHLPHFHVRAGQGFLVWGVRPQAEHLLFDLLAGVDDKLAGREPLVGGGLGPDEDFDEEACRRL